MKKVASKKLIALLVGAFVVGTGGAVLYKSQADFPKREESREQPQSSADQSDSTGKTDGGDVTDSLDKDTSTSSDTPDTSTKPATSPTNGTASLASLGTSVTAQKSLTNSTISISFYLEDSGTFTVQEKSGASWKTTTENIFYPGKNGLIAATLSSGQSSKTIRLLKNQNGKYVSATKSFTIKRSDVEASGGVKTYN